MQNFSFKENILDIEIHTQIIKLNKSYFIHISNSNMNFDNLTLSIFNKTNSCSYTSNIYEDNYNEVGISLANKLSLKYKMPIYLSFNLDDGLLRSNNELFFRVEKSLFNKINNLNIDLIN